MARIERQCFGLQVRRKITNEIEELLERVGEKILRNEPLNVLDIGYGDVGTFLGCRHLITEALAMNLDGMSRTMATAGLQPVAETLHNCQPLLHSAPLRLTR